MEAIPFFPNGKAVLDDFYFEVDFWFGSNRQRLNQSSVRLISECSVNVW
jgi:hypothetical protein